MTRTILILVCVLSVASHAAAWDPFLVANGEVEDGNERMAASDAQNALRHYDQAARQLPNEAGVHVNRGLALLESSDLDGALEAFEAAAGPGGPREIRADASYNAGLVHYRLADAAANEENHQEAQRLFREAADAFRRSLRMRPGNADAGWNLELALRRIREQEEQQQEQEQQEQQQQDQQDQQDQQQQDQQQQDQQQQDQQGDQQEDGQDQQQQDSQEGQDSQDQQDGERQQGDESSDDEESSQDEGSEEGESSPEDQQPADQEQAPATGTQERSMPPEHRRVLDALRDGEENLQRHRARARGDREQRRVEQDW